MNEPQPAVPILTAKQKGIEPQTEVVVRFSGEIYKWIEELKGLLRDAEGPQDVPTIGVELLHYARGKEIRIGSGPDAEVFNLWRDGGV